MTPDRWWSWDPERPAALIHRASGWRVAPALYSARAGEAWPAPPSAALKFGERAMDGASLAFETCFEDTRLLWRYATAGAGATMEWRAVAHGEWGLRYWLLLCVEGPEGAELVFDRATGALTGERAAAAFSAISDAPATMATFHGSTAEAIGEIERWGYFHLASRGTRGAVAALRFNLEQAPEMRLSLSVAGAAPPTASPTPEPAPDGPQAALQAVHDVIAWNHVYDDVNARPYTALTRFWNREKFGGFGVWLDDVLFNALMWSLFDPAPARDNVAAAIARRTPEGAFPCLVTGNDAWLDRSQIPVAAWVVWSVFARSGDRDWLRAVYPAIAGANAWWRARRSLGPEGFIAYGTSLDVGDGLYKGTKFAAKNESSMDNSPVHDPAPFDAGRGLLLSYDVGLNSLYALDCEMCGHIAAALGEGEAAARHFADRAAIADAISRHLWDEERGVFANRLAGGGFIAPVAPTSFYPLAAGAATEAQIERLLAWLDDPAKFGGALGLPSITRDDPAYGDNCYWRGRIWGPMNYWTWLGLRRAGRGGAAAALAERGMRAFSVGWRDRLCGENWNAETGAVFDQPDTDGFYSWGALMPLIAASEVVHLDPWEGLSLAPSAAGAAFGPIATPAGALTIASARGRWRVTRDGAAALEGDLPGRLASVDFSGRSVSARSPGAAAPSFLAPPGRDIARATLDGAPLRTQGRRAILPAHAAGALIRIEAAEMR